jgi:hypothetical protein
VETSKFSWMRLGVFEVVRGAVPRCIAQASKTCASVLLAKVVVLYHCCTAPILRR